MSARSKGPDHPMGSSAEQKNIPQSEPSHGMAEDDKQKLKGLMVDYYKTLEKIPQLVKRPKDKPMLLSQHFIELMLLEDNAQVKQKRITIEEIFRDMATSFTVDNKDQENTLRRVLIKGGPGSGKSILMNKIAFEWSQGKFKDYEFLFRVNLKELKIAGKNMD